MNTKGFFNFIPFLKNASLIWKILIVILLVIFTVPLAVSAVPILKYVIMIIIAFVVYGMVAPAFGNSILTFIVLGVMLYFIFKYFYIATGAFLLYFFLIYGFTSVLIWGTARFGR